MTVIVAIPHDGKVVMAADSCEVDDDNTVFTCARKIVELSVSGEIALVGCSGNSSVMPLMRWRVALPPAPQPDDRDDEDRWAQAVADAFTEAAREAKIVDDKGTVDGLLLLAFRGRLWALEESYAAPVDAPTAAGSGSTYALGALAAMASTKMTPRDQAERAAQIACDLHAFCRPPIVVTEV